MERVEAQAKHIGQLEAEVDQLRVENERLLTTWEQLMETVSDDTLAGAPQRSGKKKRKTNKIYRKLAPEHSSETAAAGNVATAGTMQSRVSDRALPARFVAQKSSTMDTKRVVLSAHWKFGNEMFMTMSSVFLAAVLGAKKLEGVRLPALDIATTIDGPLDEMFVIKPNEHVYPIEQMLSALSELSLHGVVNTGLGMRLEYFSGQRDFWRQQFDRLAIEPPPISNSEVVVHIRAEDILNPVHRSYYPLPLDFYDVILEELGLTPVFVGQVSGDQLYLEKLRSRYPSARFIQSSLMDDFELLRRSHTKILSISSFSWLAGWFGGDDSRVVIPVGGLFNPVARPDVNLLPMGDDRFELRRFSPMQRERDETSLDHFLEALADASAGYPRVERSAYTARDVGPSALSSDPTRFAIPTTSEEWSGFAEAVILQQRVR